MQRGSFVWMHSFKIKFHTPCFPAYVEYTFLWDFLVLMCRCCIVFTFSASISIFHRINFALETFFRACARNSGQHSAHFYRPGSSQYTPQWTTHAQTISFQCGTLTKFIFSTSLPFSISTHLMTNGMCRRVRLQQKATKTDKQKKTYSHWAAATWPGNVESIA